MVSDSDGAEPTTVVIGAAATGSVSAQSIDGALVRSVPFASGLVTFTVRLTLPEAPPFTVARFQVALPPETVAGGVAETKVVFAGSGSVRIVPVALALPVFE